MSEIQTIKLDNLTSRHRDVVREALLALMSTPQDETDMHGKLRLRALDAIHRLLSFEVKEAE